MGDIIDPIFVVGFTELKIGHDFVLNFSHATEPHVKDWIGLFMAGDLDTEYGQHWYWGTSATQNTSGLYELTWKAPFGPWRPGKYQFRYISGEGKKTVCSELFNVDPVNSLPPFLPMHHNFLRVMSFNIWESGTRKKNGLLGVAGTILEQRPHLIGIQEISYPAFNVLKEILREHYYCAHSGSPTSGWDGGAIFSRYSISSVLPSNSTYGFGSIIHLRPEKKICFFNSHLTAYPYAPYELAKGRSSESVLKEASQTQLADIQKIWSSHLQEISHPILLVGDHNIPSHLDGEISDPVYHNLRSSPEWIAPAVPFSYPVSKFLLDQGMVDSYRKVIPVHSMSEDPVQGGFTWTTLDNKKEIFDRIDFVYYRDSEGMAFKPQKCHLVDKLKGSSEDYPSDHRAVVVDFHIE